MSTDKWREELALLRSIIQTAGLAKTIKWGAEVHTHNGKNVVSFGGFKNYFALWFYNGVFLKDKYKVLMNAQEGRTKALRQWRFTSREEVNEKRILEYIREAVRNEDEGRVWKAEKSKPAETPRLMQGYFNRDKRLKSAFEKLTPYKQKEYIEHISSAKKKETKIARMEKSIPMILQGVGLHDKYKNGPILTS